VPGRRSFGDARQVKSLAIRDTMGAVYEPEEAGEMKEESV
jgi:hypothetical protein